MEDEHETTSLRPSRRKKSSMSITSCFIGSTSKHSRRFSLDGSTASSILPSPNPPSSSSSLWSRSKQPNFISRRHRRYASADFSYDPQSYALNFEDDGGEEVPLRNFSARFVPKMNKATGGVVANAMAAEVKSSLEEEERSPREILVALG